jgi:hypothetical protein
LRARQTRDHLHRRHTDFLTDRDRSDRRRLPAFNFLRMPFVSPAIRFRSLNQNQTLDVVVHRWIADRMPSLIAATLLDFASASGIVNDPYG